VAELREEVTRVWVAAIMAEAHTARVEKMAHERVVLLAIADMNMDMVARVVSVLKSELMAMHRAWDGAKEKLPSLAARQPLPISDG
jgi:hypothetical protein